MKELNDSRTNKLMHFFLFTFLFSWIMWLPGILFTYNIINPSSAFLKIINIMQWVAGIGPSLTAIILIAKAEGKAGIKILFKRVSNGTLGKWYLPILLLLPITFIAAHLINIFFFNASLPETGLLKEPWWIPILFLIFLLMQFSEELGWRGFALDNLQNKFGALTSSLIVGIIWSIWHLPMFLSKGFGQHDYHLPFIQFLITLTLLSVWIGWFQNNTKGSLVPAFIIHAYINLSGEVLPLIEKNEQTQGNYNAWIILNALLLLSVIILLFFYDAKTFVRKSTKNRY